MLPSNDIKIGSPSLSAKNPYPQYFSKIYKTMMVSMCDTVIPPVHSIHLIDLTAMLVETLNAFEDRLPLRRIYDFCLQKASEYDKWMDVNLETIAIDIHRYTIRDRVRVHESRNKTTQYKNTHTHFF